MSNEEVKNAVIKAHWEQAGFDWSRIEKLVTDSGDIAVEDPNKFQASKEYIHAYEEGLIRPTGPRLHKYHYELYSLVGIERNNGWTRIEPDGSNLPDNSGPIDVLIDGKEHRVHYNSLLKEFSVLTVTVHPSHYALVVPRLTNLY